MAYVDAQGVIHRPGAEVPSAPNQAFMTAQPAQVPVAQAFQAGQAPPAQYQAPYQQQGFQQQQYQQVPYQQCHQPVSQQQQPAYQQPVYVQETVYVNNGMRNR